MNWPFVARETPPSLFTSFFYTNPGLLAASQPRACSRTSRFIAAACKSSSPDLSTNYTKRRSHVYFRIYSLGIIKLFQRESFARAVKNLSSPKCFFIAPIQRLEPMFFFYISCEINFIQPTNQVKRCPAGVMHPYYLRRANYWTEGSIEVKFTPWHCGDSS